MPNKPEPRLIDRYADLRAFVAEWHRPLEPGDGNTEAEIVATEARLGFRLPEALRDLYMLVGKRDDITREYNRLVRLADLDVENGWLVVWEENQCVSLMAVSDSELHDPNPMVYMILNPVADGKDIHECTNVSPFALEMIAYETVIAGEWVASATDQAETPGETTELLREHYSPSLLRV